MKRIFLLGAVVVLVTTIKAQVKTNAITLKQLSLNLRKTEDSNYQKALSFASEKGWPLVLNSANGSKAYLVGLHEDGTPKYYTTYNNTIAAATTRANQLWSGGATGLNLNGSSANMKNKLGIWDGGKILTSHIELSGRITERTLSMPALSDHATHVVGTMIATGINPIVKGMSHGLQGIIAHDFQSDISEIADEASGLILSNHSYGEICGWYNNSSSSLSGFPADWLFFGRNGDNEDYKFGYYNTAAQSLDQISYNSPFYLIVKAAGNNRNGNGPAVGQPYYRYNASNPPNMVAAGNRPAGISNNDGYGIIPTDANAKNILTVGAVNGLAQGYSQKSDVIMSTFSSWGPTDDGRIKPDIVAHGVGVFSTSSSGNNAYNSKNGTSMATPNVTGSLLLLQEYYSQQKAGAFMRSATLKGLAIHTAEEAGDASGPDYKFGWGLLNVEKGAEVIKEYVSKNNATNAKHFLYENVLNNGSTYTTTFTPLVSGSLTATICWTDVQGNVTPIASALNNTSIKLVNDLDIRITRDGTTYFPWILDPSVPSASATTGDNFRDNVEKINADNLIAGETYTITISHKGSLVNGSQAYSLLMSFVPSNDIAVAEIVSPTSTDGSNAEQRLVIKLQNKGTVDKSSIPLTAVIKDGATTVATLTATYPFTLAGGTSGIYSFQQGFSTNPGTVYSVTVTASTTGDQDVTNDIKTTNIAIAPKAPTPSALGVTCSTTSNVLLKVNNPSPNTTYYWYDSPTATSPIGTGNTLTLATLPASTLYVGSGFNGGAGIKLKTNYSGGGYQVTTNSAGTASGSYIKYTATQPLILETIRLYTKFPGTFKLELLNITAENTSNGSYNFFGPLDSRIINVTSSHPSSSPGAYTGNEAADTGRIYYVGMTLPAQGANVSYALRLTGTDVNVSVFRHNGLPTGTTTIYPIATPNVFSVTGNSQFISSSNYQFFYYYFYDMKLKTADALSDRSSFTVTEAAAPVITVEGDSLTSNIASSYSWYRDGNFVPGAVTRKYKPTIDGNYHVVTVDAFGCTKASSIFGYSLPVTLTSFTAQLQNNSKVLLNWATANEVNNKSFDVEKLVSSNTSASWQKIGTITGAGNSSIVNQYSFTDNDVKQGTAIQYRLKQNDFDGQSKYSNIVAVQVNGNLVLGVNAYPNPVATIAKISYAVPQKGRATLAVYTLSGKLVTTLFDGEKYAGAYNQDYNTSKLAAGSYVLKLTANGSSVNTIINKL